MTWSDPIVDEVRRVREAYATRFNHDLQAIYRDLKEQEERSGRKVITCSKKPSEGELNELSASVCPIPTVSEPAPMQQGDPVAEQ